MLMAAMRGWDIPGPSLSTDKLAWAASRASWGGLRAGHQTGRTESNATNDTGQVETYVCARCLKT